MTSRISASLRTAALLCLLVPAAAAQAPLKFRMLAAEDARASTDAALAPILAALRSADPTLVAQAARGLGRLERPVLVKHLLPLLSHARPQVRAETANALGQALARVPRALDGPPLPPEAAIVTTALLSRLRVDPDPAVMGVVAQTLGRLPHRGPDTLRRVDAALQGLLPAAGGEKPVRTGGSIAQAVHPASLSGVAKGLEARVRAYQKVLPLDTSTLQRLRGAATLGFDPSDADFAFIRRVAWSALNGASAVDLALVRRGFDDPDAQVRRLAVAALASVHASDDERRALLAKGLIDPSFHVRYEAVRVYSRTLQPQGCDPLLTAVDDRSLHVSIAAIDALGAACPSGSGAVRRLAALADDVPDTAWHKPAHALVSLSRTAREEATSRLPRFAESRVWQVRMYAARAAAALGAAARLDKLAGDPHPNVREAAIAGLKITRGHDAAAVYVDALKAADYQLVMTAANALEGSPARAEAVPALVAAFKRLTAERRDTSRDPRVAILERLRELGSRSEAPSLRPCLSDSDPAVAQACAETLTSWLGMPHDARPAPRPPSPPLPPQLPTRARIVLTGGRSVDVRLFPDEAPYTVARFAALAQKGYYDGLTFHRVVPNFVIQGGSPGANEYMGDGPYLRDELGLRSHLRGTLGISTRGRDTGDAQIFVNLLDNVRLDHEYTVFADVTAGMDIIDAIVEGDRIETIDVLPATATRR